MGHSDIVSLFTFFQRITVYLMSLGSDYRPGAIQADQQWMVIVSVDS